MKLIAITFIAIFGLFGAGAGVASAAVEDDPRDTECAEADTRPTDLDCSEIPDGEGGLIYPPVEPEGGTVPPTTVPPTTVPGELPKTGSNGPIGLLQIGGLMLAGGLLIVVASRRRTPAPAA